MIPCSYAVFGCDRSQRFSTICLGWGHCWGQVGVTENLLCYVGDDTTLLILLFIISWSNDNNGFLSAIFAGVVALSTVGYVILTGKLVGETIRLRRAGTEPDIAVYLDEHPESAQMMNIIVHNIGSGPAYNVRFDISPDEPFFREYRLSTTGVFKGKKYIAPGQRFRSFFATGVNPPKKDGRPIVFTVVAHYQNKDGESRHESYEINPGDFTNALVGSGSLEKQQSDSIKKIADVLSNVTAFSVLRVSIEDRDRLGFIGQDDRRIVRLRRFLRSAILRQRR